MKKASTSKTIRFNAAMLALDSVILPMVAYQSSLEAGLGPTIIYVIVALKVLQGVGNVYLRYITNEPIGVPDDLDKGKRISG